MSNICFYVYAPLYQKNSNGIRMLYTLSELIRQCGYNSKVICYEDEMVNYELLTPDRYSRHTIKLSTEFIHYELEDQDIVIYSDTISDNPLNAKNVVRYLLNRPMYISGKKINYGDNDYLISYSLMIDSNLPQLFILNDDREYFYPCKFNKKENLVCIYYGKIMDTEIRDQAVLSLMETFEQSITITREFPATRVELGSLLRRARLLISLDPISNITYEATLCGTPALILNDIFGFTTQRFNIPLYGILSNVSGYDEAIKDSSLAFNKYQVVLEENEKNVKLFVDSVLQHYELLRSTSQAQLSSYHRVIAARNRSQSELDELRFSTYRNAEVFRSLDNPNYLNPFGQLLKKILVEIGFKRAFIGKYTQAKQWIKNENGILAKLFYRWK